MKDVSKDIMEKAMEGGDYPKPILLEDLGMMYDTEKSKQKKRFGLYKCGFCDKEFKTTINRVNTGTTKSCGCFKKERTRKVSSTHNLTKTRQYNIWQGIKRRATNINDIDYLYYGGRGITICDEWKNDFMSFYDWAMSNGYSDELSIDRVDNNGNYCPENCRWSTHIMQCRNRGITKNNTSGYKGVSYRKDIKKYQVEINVNKKRVRLGYFKIAVEGAIEYNNYIVENNLEGFILNEIPEGYEDGKNLLKK